MTTAPAASLEAASASGGPLQPAAPLMSRRAWAWTIALTVLFVIVHGTYLERLFRIVTQAQGDNALALLFSAITSKWDPDWSHVLVVPLISIYYIYLNRHRMATIPPRLCFWGLPLVFAGLFSYAFWIYPGRNDMFQGFSMILTLFGLVLFMLGPSMMRVLWFPIAYLVFAVKIADSYWEAIAWKLQQIAAAGSTIVLQFFSAFLEFDVELRGSTIDLKFIQNGLLHTESLNVAQACSGLRMLMAFVALGVALAFLRDRAWWQRIVMVGMAVPIALAVNIGRVSTLGLLYLVDPKYAKGDFHVFVGMLMLIPAAGLFMLLGWVLDQIIIREDNEQEPTRTAAAGAAPSAQATQEAVTPQAAETKWDWRVAALAAAGVALMLVSGLVYYGMLSLPVPLETGSLIGGLLAKMTWVALPPAIVGTVLAVMAFAVVRGGRRRFAAAAALVIGTMLTFAVSQKAVEAYTRTVLIKQAVPLRHSLLLVPTEAGPWKMTKEDPPLSAEILEALGTDKYISRIYEDTTWPENQPGRAIRLHVAYYTGTTDTVPHVPDRCFVAGGVTPVGTTTQQVALDESGFTPAPDQKGYLHPVAAKRIGQFQPPARVPATTFDATCFTYEQSHGSMKWTENVIYFFAANGKYLPTPNHVRLQGFEADEKYAYYCKVEVQVSGVDDPKEATQRASAALSHLLPEIMACLPDWVDVTEGRWPSDSAKH